MTSERVRKAKKRRFHSTNFLDLSVWINTVSEAPVLVTGNCNRATATTASTVTTSKSPRRWTPATASSSRSGFYSSLGFTSNPALCIKSAIKDGCGLYRLPVMDVMVEFQQLLGIGQQVVHHLAEPCLLRAKPRFLINAKELATKVSIPLIFLRRFSYKDIKRATDGFHRIILNSSHGTAYKAKFNSGRLALVKEIRGFGQEDDDFYREVQLLGCLHHRHIVALTGFSMGRKRFLVFESIENGSLKDHLNDPLRTPLNWRTRLHIAIGVAAALEYLHFFCEPPVYYVSISSSNIMLDENFNAKLSEVGLLGSGTNRTTLPLPSCSKESKGRVSGNVIYQLGLLILELITGQSSDEGGVDLIKWVQDSRSHRSIDNMIDPDLGNNYDSRELEGLLAVARLCIKSVDKPNSFTPQIFRYLQEKVRRRPLDMY